jgi:adenosylhomocysteine nucleosidase
MWDLAVFAALGWERRAVTDALGTVERTGPRTWRGRLGDGASCAVVQTGVGLERARTEAASVEPARLFLACGCAGALVDALGPGDTVVAASVLALDGDAAISARFPARAESLAAWAKSRGMGLHVGPIVSAPGVLESFRTKERASACGALVVEMESAAIAAEACTRGIPFVGIRVVLDEQGQAVPALDAIDHVTGEMRIGRAVGQLAARPWLWPAVGRLARQARIAEARLRTVLGAVFGDGMSALTGEPAVVSAIG